MSFEVNTEPPVVTILGPASLSNDTTPSFTGTASENTEVVRSLVEIARARGWTEVTVRGTERFRKEAWTAEARASRRWMEQRFDQTRLAEERSAIIARGRDQSRMEGRQPE